MRDVESVQPRKLLQCRYSFIDLTQFTLTIWQCHSIGTPVCFKSLNSKAWCSYIVSVYTEEYCSLLCLILHQRLLSAIMGFAANSCLVSPCSELCLLTWREMSQRLPLESSFHAESEPFQRPSEKISVPCQPDAGIQMAFLAWGGEKG